MENQTIISICVVVFCTTLVGLLFFALIKRVRESECRKINKDIDVYTTHSDPYKPISSKPFPKTHVFEKPKGSHITKHNAKYPRTGK